MKIPHKSALVAFTVAILFVVVEALAVTQTMHPETWPFWLAVALVAGVVVGIGTWKEICKECAR